MKKILFILLIVSIVLNCFLINKIYKFKKAIASYRAYINELKDKFDNIQQRAGIVKNIISNSIRKEHK